MKSLKIDVMLGERFFRTVRIPLDPGMVKEYIFDTPVIRLDVLEKRVLEKLPPPVGHERYHFCFV